MSKKELKRLADLFVKALDNSKTLSKAEMDEFKKLRIKLEKAMKNETPEEEEEEDNFEEIYEKHVKKFGNSLYSDPMEKESNYYDEPEISEEDQKFYEEYAKQFGNGSI
ncbi:hypothetical protein [Alteribacillus sp. HJP-4]|uniref:hypothetical protein n=1 Tax=Alteribacillus sp. HJP-4 TaxID=2775394 RepID=UPI0035CCFF02